VNALRQPFSPECALFDRTPGVLGDPVRCRSGGPRDYPAAVIDLPIGGLALAVVALLIVGTVAVVASRATGSRRTLSRRTIVVATAAAVLIGGSAVVWTSLSRQQQIRLEVHTRSGTASEVVWNTGQQNRVGGVIPTPWSFTTTERGFGGLITLAATSARSDEVTCRIVVDGETVAEQTDTFATACSYI
jgi:hypothetical protein